MNTQSTRRIFIAVPIPLPIREKLSDVGHHLKNRVQPPAKRWLYRDDYHITLQFLGNMDDDYLSMVSDCLEEYASTVEPFKLEITRPILFPSLRHPVVIACPIRPNLLLDRAATTVSRLMTQFGFQEISLPYRGHITLARIHSQHPPRVPFLGMDTLEMTVTSFGVFQSIIEPQRDPHYRVLREYKLKGA